MKATGIVRRIDELGRIVIPKEIRRTQRIRRGDPLEIFTTGEGEVIFKKYSPMREMAALAEQYAAVLARYTRLTAFICDKEQIIAAAGTGRRELAEQHIARPLEQLLERHSSYFAGRDGEPRLPCQGSSRPLLAACPILTGGDTLGAIGILAGEGTAQPTEAQHAAVELAAALLAKQMEE